jgi:hypothetical protein
MADHHQASSVRGVTITRMEYHGWRESFLLTNGIVEAVVVPSISRIMQFRMAGERGVFWENRALDGVSAHSGNEWRNFGGDKAWPAPQEDWEPITGRAWPPPPTFDSASSEASVYSGGLLLTSPVDRDYGVQVYRAITLRPGLPVMDITTRYCKVAGPPVHLAVWVVTQLCNPQRIYALLPESHSVGPGYTQIHGEFPADVQKDGRLLSLRRDATHNLKIAMEGNSLVWMNEEYVLSIDAYSAHGAENKCTTAIYTNMDPLQYVELESMGQVDKVAVGDTLELSNSYTLARSS